MTRNNLAAPGDRADRANFTGNDNVRRHHDYPQLRNLMWRFRVASPGLKVTPGLWPRRNNNLPICPAIKQKARPEAGLPPIQSKIQSLGDQSR
jgi:hypothetical protein